ncbi:hypothetical protein AB0O86_05585 [Streptomyces hirsutus]|uniref:hypothetical protein n=1 Tax=Streptomyces hirsutus TaxID=35620 RepID=UPI00342C864F
MPTHIRDVRVISSVRASGGNGGGRRLDPVDQGGAQGVVLLRHGAGGVRTVPRCTRGHRGMTEVNEPPRVGGWTRYETEPARATV